MYFCTDGVDAGHVAITVAPVLEVLKKAIGARAIKSSDIKSALSTLGVIKSKRCSMKADQKKKLVLTQLPDPASLLENNSFSESKMLDFVYSCLSPLEISHNKRQRVLETGVNTAASSAAPAAHTSTPSIVSGSGATETADTPGAAAASATGVSKAAMNAAPGLTAAVTSAAAATAPPAALQQLVSAIELLGGMASTSSQPEPAVVAEEVHTTIDDNAGLEPELFACKHTIAAESVHVDEHCQMLKGMIKHAAFGEDATNAWLSDTVSVFVQYITRTRAGGVQVSFEPQGEGYLVERIKVLHATVVWYAMDVLGCPLSIVGDDVSALLDVSEETVEIALAYIDERIKDVDAFDASIYTYIFDGARGVKKQVGFYAKDLDASGLHKVSMLDKAKACGLYTADFLQLYDQDLLPTIAPMAKGLCFNKSWFYNGGFGLAGWHAEDAGMHFGHQSIALECNTRNPLTAKVLDMYMKFSRKTWVMFKKTGAEGMQELNGILAKSSGGQHCTDEHLVSRSLLLDPRKVTQALGPDFVVLHQYPGHLFMSVYPHQVFGWNLWSFAWNYCFPNKLMYYIDVESKLARSVRVAKWHLVDDRKFLLSSALIAAVTYEAKPDVDVKFKVPLLNAARSLCLAELSEAGPTVLDGSVLGNEEGLPSSPHEAQCARCKGPIIDRFYLAGSRGGQVRRVWCVKCAKLETKPFSLLSGHIIGLAWVRRLTGSLGRK